MNPLAFIILSSKPLSLARRRSANFQPPQRAIATAASIINSVSHPTSDRLLLSFATNNIMSKRNSSNSKKSTKKPKNTKDQQPPQPPPEDVDEWFAEFTKKDPVYADYLTNEWGFEKRSEQELFENLSLEGAQCGLSWRTILRKREAYRRAYHNFDIDSVASMTDGDAEEILSATSRDATELVVRHRGKVESVIHNAKLIRGLKANGTISSFSEYLWSFVDDKPILNRFQSISDMPSKTEESERMSEALRKHGFKFVGPTTMYAMMQSCGFVIDHLVGSKHWADAEVRLKNRVGGYQIR